jgi:hypothetical protein
MIDALSVRALLSAPLPPGVVEPELRAPGWTSVPWEGFRLWKNEEALPRIRLVPCGRGVSEEEFAGRLERGDFDPRVEALWVGAEEVGDLSLAPGRIEVLSERWDEIVVAVECDAAQVLVVADTYSPGWRAEVDGRHAEIRKVYGVIRGVPIPAGRHQVRMWYAPAVFRIGLTLTLAGGVLTLLLLLLGAVRRKA